MVGGWSGGRGPEELADADAPVELLGTSTVSVDPDHTTPATPDDGASSSRPATLVVLAGLAVVAALLVLLARPGQTGDGSDGPADGAASPPATSTPPTTRSARTPATVPTTALPALAAPVAGEPSGMTLFLGGDQPLTAIDLDSGEVSRYGLTAHPVLATGGDLVLYQEEVGIVGWVPIEDPGRQALSWKRGRVAAGSGPGLLWILDPEVDEPHPAGVDVGFGRWELFETATNRRVFRMPGDLYPDIERFIEAPPTVGGPFEALRPGPWFSTRRDGVYRAIEDGYTLVTTGRVLTNDEDAVLVEQCTIEGTCTVAWFAVETGEPVDRALPRVRPRVARLVGGGAWLHSVGWAGTSELLELATGRRVEHDWAEARPTLSPDGRWLAHWAGPSLGSGSGSGAGYTLVISDLAADGAPRPVAEIDTIERGRSPGLLFVQTAPVSVTDAGGVVTMPSGVRS